MVSAITQRLKNVGIKVGEMQKIRKKSTGIRDEPNNKTSYETSLGKG